LESRREEKLMLAAAAAAILLLVASLWLSVRNTQALMERGHRVAHTYQVINAVDETLSSVIGAEAGSRGYALTGNMAFLPPYDEAVQILAGQIAELRGLVKDNPRQVERVDRLEAAIRGKMEYMAAYVELVRIGRAEEGRSRVAAGTGLRLMAEVRGIAREMIDAERGLLRDRSAQSLEAGRLAIVSNIASTLLAVVLVCVLFLLVRGYTRSMVRSTAEIQALNVHLRRAVRETHHRVKNNLQVITAMVDMKLMDGDADVRKEDLRRVGHHARALAVIHDLLTEGATQEATATVSAKGILDRLLPLLQMTTPDRRVQAKVEDATLSARQGTSLALVLNELVSNGLKYGKGELDVTFEVEGGRALLEVCDDGPGFPDGFDAAQQANTGLELVESLARWDLGGDVIYETRPEGGARVRVSVPLSPVES
jgi:two-component sensor histidine kinase